MDEETQENVKVEINMEEEGKTTVATTMKIHVGIKIHQDGIAKIVVIITQAVVTNL